jgi:hypothetical protein
MMVDDMDTVGAAIDAGRHEPKKALTSGGTVPKAARGGFRQGGKLAALAGGDSDARRKAIGRVLRVLTETPADATGMVPETPFSKTGVKRLMEMLQERSAQAGASGGRIAAGLLRFLAPKDGEEAIHGASLAKLQRGGKLAARRAGGRGRRRGV